MATKCMGARIEDETDRTHSVPPGFVSLTSFTLQRVQDDVMLPSACAPDSVQPRVDSECSIVGDEKFKKSLRCRPWINYSQFDNSSEEESDSELFEQDIPSIRWLPKGVLRGCPDCRNCQKVTAKWRPKDACKPVLEEAPVFYPNEEEFKDTLKYIASIRPKAEPYGICRIVPPPSWSPPCPLKEKGVWENSKFATRIQQVDKLQNRNSLMKSCRNSSFMKRKRRKLLKMDTECRKSNENIVVPNELGYHNYTERFGFEPGPEFTLESFQKYAGDFKNQYFHTEDMNTDAGSNQDEFRSRWEPSVENIEGEYWRIVERPTEEIEVLYGADLETGVFGSGFPKLSLPPTSCDLEDKYLKSGWNLNNIPRLPGSVLSFESGDISGILVPWLYIGMCFSSFCWHVEDHHLYSLNYLHWGAPKIWYGVPGKDALKLEGTMKKHLADLFKEQPDLLHNLVTQFSPSMLKLEGVPVYRCVQHSGEFVLTFPRAYHSGFNCGFNCAEAVNVAPIDWLPHGQNAVELYCAQGRKISISQDKLLLGAAREAVRAQWNISFLGKSTLDYSRWKDFCGLDRILAKALKARVEMERVRREYLCCSSQSRKMDASFDSNSDRECVVCHYDLHLSAAGCPCSPDRFACLIHAKQLCLCASNTRFFLFRYEISELNTLLDALGGKLSAVHRWGLSDLGLSLSSYASKEKTPEPKPVSRTSLQKEKGPQDQSCSTSVVRSATTSQEINASMIMHSIDLQKAREKMITNAVNSTSAVADPTSVQQTKSITTSASKEPLRQGGTEDLGLKVSEEHICYDTNLSGFPGNQNSPKDTLDTSLLKSTSSEQNRMDCAVLVPIPEDMHLSNPKNRVSKTDKSLLSDGDVLLLSYDECERAHKLPRDKNKEEPFVEYPEAFARLTNSDDKVTSCNSKKDQVLVTPETNVSNMSEGNKNLPTVMEKCGILSNSTLSIEVKDQGKEGTCRDYDSCLPNQQLSRSFPENTYDRMNSVVVPISRSSPEKTSHGVNSVDIPISKQSSRLLTVKEGGNCSITNIGSHLQYSQLSGSVKPIFESQNNKTETDYVYNLTDRESVTASPSCPSNSLDKYNRQQKGPRIAKVVRRITCNVEPLEYGVVFSGKLWSTSQAIFPKGYRSRVRYFSILDPAQMCYYVSEILDAGLLGPLFMVSVEQRPSEVFIHVSATKCWDMVRERVNHEIVRHHSLGKTSLPSLQPPGSVDGLEMFGLSSPTIIQAIEAIDQNHVCSEYWSSRCQNQTASVRDTLSGNDGPSLKEESGSQDQSLLVGTDVAIRGLLKKANPEELQALHGILNNDRLSTKHEVLQLLNKEIESRSKSISFNL